MRYPLQVGTSFHDYPVNVMPPMFVQYKETTNEERIETIAQFLELTDEDRARLTHFTKPQYIDTLKCAWAEAERARLPVFDGSEAPQGPNYKEEDSLENDSDSSTEAVVVYRKNRPVRDPYRNVRTIDDLRRVCF